MKALRYTLPAIVLTALMHTICCVVPLFALLVGSGSWLALPHYVAPYKPYLITLNLLLLGFAFYRAYGATRPCAHRKREQIAVWLAAGLSAGMLLAEPVLQRQRDEGSRLAMAQMQVIMHTRQVVLCIEPAEVSDHLRTIAGVLRVEQSANCRHLVRYDRTQTSAKKIILALRRKGCRVREVNARTVHVSG